MSKETDDLLDELINAKPQKKSEVFSHKSTVAKGAKLEKPKAKDLEYVTLTTDAVCRSCGTELGVEESHWVYDDWVDKHWWCVTCAWEQCELTPPENNYGA